jgi:hypothetical protein
VTRGGGAAMEFIYLLLITYGSRQGCYFDPIGNLVFSLWYSTSKQGCIL